MIVRSPTLPVVVIGAGFGGIASAIRLRARGWPVLMLEANEQPGGRASVYREGGYTFDAGPTVITAPYLLDELFALSGARTTDHLEMLPVDPFYRVNFTDGVNFDYVGDEDRLLSQIEALSPPDVDGYRKMAKRAKQIFDIGYLKLAEQPFDKLSEMLRIVPDLLRLGGHRSVYSLVSSYIKDDHLRQVFTFQPLLVGGNPFDVSAIYMLIHWLERKWGVMFPRGGTGALVRALIDRFTAMGGELRLSSPVSEIEVEAGKAVAVRTAGGERIACSFVVANADPSTVYQKLVAAKHRKMHTDRRIARVRSSMGLFVGYFGTNKTFPDVKHHTIVLGPRYRGLLEDIFHRRVLAKDFSLYLHRPTASDPALAPAGNDAWYVLSPVPNATSDVDWSTMAAPYFDAILQSLDQRVAPGISASVTTRMSIDPRTFADRYRSKDGAAFGPEPLLTQSAWLRYHNKSDDVDGLFFVGAGTHPGAGVPGVLTSAKVLDRLVGDAPGFVRRDAPIAA